MYQLTILFGAVAWILFWGYKFSIGFRYPRSIELQVAPRVVFEGDFPVTRLDLPIEPAVDTLSIASR